MSYKCQQVEVTTAEQGLGVILVSADHLYGWVVSALIQSKRRCCSKSKNKGYALQASCVAFAQPPVVKTCLVIFSLLKGKSRCGKPPGDASNNAKVTLHYCCQKVGLQASLRWLLRLQLDAVAVYLAADNATVRAQYFCSFLQGL